MLHFTLLHWYSVKRGKGSPSEKSVPRGWLFSSGRNNLAFNQTEPELKVVWD